MVAIWSRLRSEARSRWRSWLGLAALVGVFGGVVLTAAAGARRTDTAYPRLLQVSEAGEVFISPGFNNVLRGSYDEIRRLPQVAEAGMVGVPWMTEVPQSGTSHLSIIFPMASADGRYGYTIHRPNVLEGRLPRREDPTEALVDPNTAQKLGLAVGRQITMRVFPEPPANPSRIQPSEGIPVALTVVGIGVFPDQVVPTQPLEELPRLFLSPAAYRVYGASAGSMVYEEIFIRLKPGADLDAFRSEVDRITAADPGAGGHNFSVAAEHRPKVERAIRPEATALALFALFAAAAGLLVIAQTLARQIRLEATEYPTLRALGMTRRQLVIMTVTRTVTVALGGGVLAAVLAIASSPLTPIGPARLAEPHPGVSVNVAMLVGGVGVLVVLLAAVTAWPTWRAAAASSGVLGTAEMAVTDRPSRLVSALSRSGVPVAALAGVRLAVEPGRGRSALPVGNTVGATTLAVLALVTAMTFGANLDRLIANPHRYGKTWDAALEGGYTNLPARSTIARLSSDPTIAAFSGGVPGEVVIAGRTVPALGIDRLQGSVFPTLLEGRPPSAPDEIVLGTKVMHRLRSSVGDSVPVEVGGSRRDMRIVGRSVFPALGVPGHFYTGLGEGSAVTGGVLPPVSPPDPKGEDVYNFFLVRFRPDADREGLMRLEADAHRDGPFGPPCNTNAGACVVTTQIPGDIANYARVRATPLALAALLLLLGLATLAHTLVSSIRRRAPDLAILKTLGFVSRQLSNTVAWQATTIAVLSMLIGLPLGVTAGRWAWIIFAEQLGVETAPMIPLLPLLVVASAGVAIANLIALLPARAAARVAPAVVLKSE